MKLINSMSSQNVNSLYNFLLPFFCDQPLKRNILPSISRAILQLINQLRAFLKLERTSTGRRISYVKLFMQCLCILQSYLYTYCQFFQRYSFFNRIILFIPLPHHICQRFMTIIINADKNRKKQKCQTVPAVNSHYREANPHLKTPLNQQKSYKKLALICILLCCYY